MSSSSFPTSLREVGIFISDSVFLGGAVDALPLCPPGWRGGGVIESDELLTLTNADEKEYGFLEADVRNMGENSPRTDHPIVRDRRYTLFFCVPLFALLLLWRYPSVAEVIIAVLSGGALFFMVLYWHQPGKLVAEVPLSVRMIWTLGNVIALGFYLQVDERWLMALCQFAALLGVIFSFLVIVFRHRFPGLDGNGGSIEAGSGMEARFPSHEQ